jgi:hypothetical protein
MDMDIDMDMISDLTHNWARNALKSFPNWEFEELHNEAFLIAVHLVRSGRYKPERAKLSTFLWYALPLDVRHRYRKANGERYLKTEDGKSKYRKTEFVSDDLVKMKQESSCVSFIESKQGTIGNEAVNQEWLIARIEGYKPRELQKRGMSYEQQRGYARNLKNELKGKR